MLKRDQGPLLSIEIRYTPILVGESISDYISIKMGHDYSSMS